jgi:transcriptional regulator with XRE-family HTH domain
VSTRCNVAERIREIRIENGLTQTELAARRNVTKSLICKIEANKASIHLDLLLDIARALDVTVSDLLEDPPSRKMITVVKEKDRKRFSANHMSSKAGYEYHRLAGSKEARMENIFLAIHSDARNTARFVTHDGYEFVFVLSGSLKLEFRENDYVLDTGDSVFFDASKPHRMVPYQCELALILLTFAYTKANA